MPEHMRKVQRISGGGQMRSIFRPLGKSMPVKPPSFPPPTPQLGVVGHYIDTRIIPNKGSVVQTVVWLFRSSLHSTVQVYLINLYVTLSITWISMTCSPPTFG